jgi:hypothetical protein
LTCQIPDEILIGFLFIFISISISVIIWLFFYQTLFFLSFPAPRQERFLKYDANAPLFVYITVFICSMLLIIFKYNIWIVRYCAFSGGCKGEPQPLQEKFSPASPLKFSAPPLK